MYLKSNRYIYAISTVIVFITYLIGCLGLSTYADTTNNSIKLICKTDDVILSGMDWSMYRVGNLNSNGEYVLEGDFEDYSVSMKNLSTSDMLDVANTLENYAILDSINPISSGITDSSGVISFADLEIGLYLFSGRPVIIDNKKYIPSAFLIEVEKQADGTSQIFDLTTYPKFRVIEITNEPSEYSVRKVWLNDENYLNDRPIDIQVEIYKDTVLVDTVTLNSSNDWTYSWTYSENVEWRVKEINVSKDYTVIYRFNETQYLILNSHDESRIETNPFNNNTNGSIITDSLLNQTTTSDITTISNEYTTKTTMTSTFTDYTNTTMVIDTNITSTSESVKVTSTNINVDTSLSNNNSNNNSKVTTNANIDKLPQTGQLWWPVPILAVSGLIFIAVGCQLKSKD